MIDGWRITVAPVERQALMSSWAEIGWRIGNLAAGAGALYLADAVGWRAAYLCMAVLMAPGMVAALLAPEPQIDRTAPAARTGLVATRGGADPRAGGPARPVGVAGAAHGGWLPHARLRVQRDGGAAVQEPALLQHGHRHRHQAVRLRRRHRRHLRRQLRGAAGGHHGEPGRGNRVRLRLAPERSPTSRCTATTAAASSGCSPPRSASTASPTRSPPSC